MTNAQHEITIKETETVKTPDTEFAPFDIKSRIYVVRNQQVMMDSDLAMLFERISNVELKQLEYQKQTDEKLEQIFKYISEHEE